MNSSPHYLFHFPSKDTEDILDPNQTQGNGMEVARVEINRDCGLMMVVDDKIWETGWTTPGSLQAPI